MEKIPDTWEVDSEDPALLVRTTFCLKIKMQADGRYETGHRRINAVFTGQDLVKLEGMPEQVFHSIQFERLSKITLHTGADWRIGWMKRHPTVEEVFPFGIFRVRFQYVFGSWNKLIFVPARP